MQSLLLAGVHVDDVVLSPSNEGKSGSFVATGTGAFSVQIAVKLDDDFELVRQARALRQVRERTDLSSEFRESFPAVYAIADKRRPYGYLMENFGDSNSLAGHLKRFSADAPRCSELVQPVYKLIFSAYESSKNQCPSLCPNLRRTYLERIESRVASIQAKFSEFGWLVEEPLTINGDRYPALKTLVSQLQETWYDLIPDIESEIVTFVHGDVHPGNVLLIPSERKLTIKIIDPRATQNGDYLFDVARFLNHLRTVLPLEIGCPRVRVSREQRRIDFRQKNFKGLSRVDRMLLIKARNFAISVGDMNWKRRLELGTVALDLSLPERLIKDGEGDQALVALSAGISGLSQVLKR